MSGLDGRRSIFVGIGIAMAATSAWAVLSIAQDDRDLRTGVPDGTTSVPSPTPGTATVAGTTVSGAPPTAGAPPTTAAPAASTTGLPASTPVGSPVPSSAPAPAPAPDASTTTTTSNPEENTGDRPAPGAVQPPSFFAEEDTSAADGEAISQSEEADAEQHAREAQEVWDENMPFSPGPTEPFIPVGPEYGDELGGG